MRKSILLGMVVCLTACTAPQGKKLAMNDGAGLEPVATGPDGQASIPAMAPAPIQVSTVTLANRDETIGLHTNKTLTVTLPSYNRNGYEWRLSEIPDPTVLKLVSQERTPGLTLAQPGEQTMVFEAVGPGSVPVKMWYGALWASRMEANKPFGFVASVTPEPPAPAKTKSKTKKVAPKVTPKVAPKSA